MKQSAFFMILMSAGMTFLLLFQNCSQLESKKTPQVNFVQNDSQGDSNNPGVNPPPVILPPVVADFGERFALDNLQSMGTLDFDIATGDKVYFETDYQSTLMLTLVTIQNVAGTNVISVSGDSCTNQGAIAFADIDALFTIIAAASAAVMPKVLAAGETVTPDCAFPRLGLDGVGAKIDYELYTAPRNCVPETKLFNVIQAADLNNWFNSQIDAVCSQTI